MTCQIALVYDRVNKFGGAERLLQILHEIWPDAPLYTSVYDSHSAPWADGWDIRPSFLQNFPGAKVPHEALGWMMPAVFESINLSEFDVIISLTSEAAKGIITSPRQLHVCYLLTPTRYLWSHSQIYAKTLPVGLRSAGLVVSSWLRQWDYLAAQRPDVMISISEHVKRRCEKYYRRGSEVMYPPLPLPLPSAIGAQQRQHLLVVSRLVPYKRVDLAIEVCNQLKLPLVVVGTGSDQRRLKSLAGPFVRFVGHLTDGELVGYYQRAKALLMPQEEDLGLVALEAQAYGVPVITSCYSGATELVVPGKTGVICQTSSREALVEAVRVVGRMSDAAENCRKHARRFSKGKFKREFQRTIEHLWATHQTICL